MKIVIEIQESEYLNWNKRHNLEYYVEDDFNNKAYEIVNKYANITDTFWDSHMGGYGKIVTVDFEVTEKAPSETLQKISDDILEEMDIEINRIGFYME